MLHKTVVHVRAGGRGSLPTWSFFLIADSARDSLGTWQSNGVWTDKRLGIKRSVRKSGSLRRTHNGYDSRRLYAETVEDEQVEKDDGATIEEVDADPAKNSTFIGQQFNSFSGQA